MVALPLVALVFVVVLSSGSAAANDVCTGHRCDTAACPCGCECGTAADPGLCFVPTASAAAVAAAAVTSPPAAGATGLAVNGLSPRDMASSPFPRDGPFVLSWAPPLPSTGVGLGTASATNSTTSTTSTISTTGTTGSTNSACRRSVEIHVAAEGALGWTSRFIVPDTESSFLLPATLTASFAEDATYQFRVVHWVSAASASSTSASSTSASSTVALAAISDTVVFDVAPSAAAMANATWIGGGSELRADWLLGAPARTRSSSTAAAAAVVVVRARAYMSGLGLADLFINGAKVGDHVCDPGEAVFDRK